MPPYPPLADGAPAMLSYVAVWSALCEGDAAPPFSFRYGERPAEETLTTWQRSASESVERGVEVRTVAWVDPATGLEVRCVARRIPAFHAVEWVLHFRNAGAAPTPILADILPLDAAFALPREQGARVHHARGSDCARDDFAPLVTSLNPDPAAPQAPWLGGGNPLVIRTHGGRSSNGALPFYNLELGEAWGVIGGIGWTGDWEARFWRGDGGEVHAQAGMQRTHLSLQPGEEIRTPSILLLFWEGERLDGHNVLRRFLLEHHTPRPGGQLLQAPVSFALWGENREERQLGKLRWFAENRLPLDNFWIDAGWHGDGAYHDNSNVFNSEWGRHVGNWWPNVAAYPNGLGPIGQAAREAGMRFTLWFEPERVFAGTAFTQEHPDWLLGPIGSNYLFNLGLPEAREALMELISAQIEAGGITCYRQDFNMDPAPFWAAADAPDRVGMSEIRHIEGLYAFWDALLERHPGLIIDNCSSGGRRIDLETISRSIPLWRSDYQCFPAFDPIGMQGQTHGLSLWVPLSTGCCDRPEDYAFRSALGPGVVFGAAVNPAGDPEGYLTPWEAFPVDWLREAMEEEQAVRRCFYGDFYPLCAYSLADDAWAAWQFDRPDLGEGMILALRRPRSPFPELVAALRGLDLTAQYELRDRDTGATSQASGRHLTAEGIVVRIDERPGARLITYRRTDG